MPSPQEIAADFGIPDDAVRNIDPASPPALRMMAAMGTLPVPPKVLMSILYVLAGDPDEKVRNAARGTLLGMPESLLVDNIDPRTHPRLLQFLAFNRKDPKLLETIALRRQSNDETLCYLAETATGDILEIIAGNQERTLVTPELLLHLKANPECPAALIDKVAGWHRMNSIELQQESLMDGLPPEVREAMAARPDPSASPAPVDEGLLAPGPAVPPPVAPGEGVDEAWIPDPSAVAAPPMAGGDDAMLLILQDMGIELRPEYFDQGDADESDDRRSRRPMDLKPIEVKVDQNKKDDELGLGSLLMPMSGANFDFSLDRGDEDWDMNLLMDHEETSDELKSSIAQLVAKMTVGQKIKLAYLGNKECREILIKDTNRMVSAAVVKSGRLTEPEVVKCASNRGINDEVLRMIAQNREWVRKYQVKVALVNNPKTPVSTAMTMLSSLLPQDLKSLAGNRNVSSVLFTAAKTRLRQRGG